MWKLLYMTPRSPFRLESQGGLKDGLWRARIRCLNSLQRMLGKNGAWPIALFCISDDPAERNNLMPFSGGKRRELIGALHSTKVRLAARAESGEQDVPAAFTPEEAAVVNERLKDLGYL